MKKFFLSGLLACVALSAFSQIPQAVNYQAVARNSTGGIIPNQNVSVRFTISYGPNGVVEYQQTDTVMTNQFGLFTVQLGFGTVVQGNFSTISWSDSAQYLKVEMAYPLSSAYNNMGIAQLISVPYALYAKTAGNSWQNYASYDERVQTNYPPFTVMNDSVWNPRALNNTEYQVGSAITKNGSYITLAPGTYHITASAPWGWDIRYDDTTNWAFPQAQSQLRIRDITQGTTLLLSPSDQVTDTRTNLIGSVLHNTHVLYMEGEITITSTDTIEFQHLLRSFSYLSGPVNYDLGIPMNSGEDEIYATLNIQKIN